MSDDLVKRYRQLQEVIGGCHDGYCVVRKPKGMHTNGGCTCLEDLRLHERSRIGHLLRCAQEMADRIEELEERLEAATDDAKEAEAYAGELEAKLERVTDVALRLYYGSGVVTGDMHATIAEMAWRLYGGKDE